MNLLDKYMVEVGKKLPKKNRLDLQAEIRSTIEDMLEDRSQQTGKPVDDALMGEVLQEYGSPTKVAEAYQPTRYLIGPQLYPLFVMVLKIVIAVLTVLTIIRLGFDFATAGAAVPDLLTKLGEHGLQYLTGIISAFGNIVLVFAILERVLPAAKFEDKDETWSPADLNAEPDPNEVKRSGLIGEILVIMLGLALFNLYPNLIGFTNFKDGNWVFVPALSAAFFRYLPWINLLGALHMLLDLYLLRQGVWQTATRVFSIVLEAAGIALAATMLLGPSLVSLNPQTLAAIFGEASEILLRIFNLLPQFVLTILVIVESVEVLQKVWRLLIPRSTGKGFILPN